MPIRVLALMGALVPLVFTASWITAAALQAEYSARAEDVSALAARTADHPWIMIAGLALTGLLTAAFSLSLRAVLVGRGAALGAHLVGLAGVATVGLALLRNDCSSLTEICEKRVDAGEVSWEHTAHDVLSFPVFACVALAPAVLAFTFRVDRRFSALWRYSLATAGAVWILLLLAGLEQPRNWQGAVQKVAVSAALAWLEVVALRVWIVARRPP